MAKMAFRLPPAASVIENPSPEELKELAARMSNALPTRYGNLNVNTEVVNRLKRSTFIVTDEPDGQNQSISREDGLKVAEQQDAYIRDQEMVVIDGYIGNDPEFRTPTRRFGSKWSLVFDTTEPKIGVGSSSPHRSERGEPRGALRAGT